jgi:PAS domain S-box-containing protein
VGDRAVSVRIAQLLAAIVLALSAIFLYTFYDAYLDTAASNSVRAIGTRAAERETSRIDSTLNEIEALAAAVSSNGYRRDTFAAASRVALSRDPALQSIDYFNSDGTHVIQITRNGPTDLTHPTARPLDVSFEMVTAVNIVLERADLTHATTASDVLRPQRRRGEEESPLWVFAASPIIVKREPNGEIVGRIDIRSLIIDDLRSIVPPAKFTLDDSTGRLDTSWPPGGWTPDRSAQSFPITFADRQWRLLVEPAQPVGPAQVGWFVIGAIALWLLLAWPIEIVGQINRRVRVLNEGLEERVAARTRQLQTTVAQTRRLAAVVESVSEGVMLVDMDGIVRYANAALGKELRCGARDIVDKAVVDLAPLALSRTALEEIRATVAKLGYVYVETARTRTDGSRYWAGIAYTAQRDQDGKMVGLIGVSRDITDRRALVDQLVTAKEDLERQMRVRADFIGTASHELRTPATTLRTLCALLVSKIAPRYALADDDRNLISLFDRETKRLSDLVDDLLEVGQIDAAEAHRPEADVDLNQVARSEVESFHQLDDRDSPPIDLRLSSAPAIMRGDEVGVRRIVVNLISNARKFTPRSGIVQVAVERSASGVRLAVSDTGAGIPEADLPHIFDRFYRVDRPGTAIRGTGLGLAIVARLVEQMHGRIAVSSEVGKGTTVSIEFPAVDAGVASAEFAQPTKTA